MIIIRFFTNDGEHLDSIAIDGSPRPYHIWKDRTFKRVHETLDYMEIEGGREAPHPPTPG